MNQVENHDEKEHVAKSIGHRLYRFPEENDSRGVKMKRIIQSGPCGFKYL